MAGIHCKTHSRECGALTDCPVDSATGFPVPNQGLGIASGTEIADKEGNGHIYANNLLVAVTGETNDHGAGGFSEPSGRTVYINGKKVIMNGDTAGADTAGHPGGVPPLTPDASQGSTNVFIMTDA